VKKATSKNPGAIPDARVLFPRPGDKTTVYLQNVVKNPNIVVGEYTIHHDFNDPTDFETENVLYHYPAVGDKLIIGKYCSIACGARFIMNGANHKMASFTTYPFPVVAENWGLEQDVQEAWDIAGDTVIGNDVWIGYQSMIMPGVHVGDGAVVAARSLVTKDVPPFSIVGGMPARVLKKRFTDDVIELLQALKWWDWDVKKVRASVVPLMSGDVEALKKLLSKAK
jgi:virginiamycin A acetyltransferase